MDNFEEYLIAHSTRMYEKRNEAKERNDKISVMIYEDAGKTYDDVLATYRSKSMRTNRLVKALEEVEREHKDILKEVAWIDFCELIKKYPSASHIVFDEAKEIEIKSIELRQYARGIQEKKVKE